MQIYSSLWYTGFVKVCDKRSVSLRLQRYETTNIQQKSERKTCILVCMSCSHVRNVFIPSMYSFTVPQFAQESKENYFNFLLAPLIWSILMFLAWLSFSSLTPKIWSYIRHCWALPVCSSPPLACPLLSPLPTCMELACIRHTWLATTLKTL